MNIFDQIDSLSQETIEKIIIKLLKVIKLKEKTAQDEFNEKMLAISNDSQLENLSKQIRDLSEIVKMLEDDSDYGLKFRDIQIGKPFKLSKETKKVIKSFAKINNGMVFVPGYEQHTITPSFDLLAKGIIQQSFPIRFGIGDINLFLTLCNSAKKITMFSDHFHFSNEINTIKLFFTDENHIITPRKLPYDHDNEILRIEDIFLTEMAEKIDKFFNTGTMFKDFIIHRKDGKICFCLRNEESLSSSIRNTEYNFNVRDAKDGELEGFYFSIQLHIMKLISFKEGSFNFIISKKDEIYIFRIENRMHQIKYWTSLNYHSD